MDDLARHHWLYIRGDQSIHMTRVQAKLRVAGPGTIEHLHVFNEAGSVEDFLRLYREALIRDGWVLQAYVDRRAAEGQTGDRRPGVERRRPRVWAIEEPE